MRALVNRPICPLMTRPSRQCERGDEALSGMVLDLLEETLPCWYRVRTPYRYEGYVSAEDLLLGEAHAARWAAQPKQVVLKGLCDVLSGPAVACFPLTTLTRGALVAPVGEPDEKGWQQVELPDGREGYTKRSFLGEYYEKPRFSREEDLRRAVTETALSYLAPTTAGGARPRWASTAPGWSPLATSSTGW